MAESVSGLVSGPLGATSGTLGLAVNLRLVTISRPGSGDIAVTTTCCASLGLLVFGPTCPHAQFAQG